MEPHFLLVVHSTLLFLSFSLFLMYYWSSYTTTEEEVTAADGQIELSRTGAKTTWLMLCRASLCPLLKKRRTGQRSLFPYTIKVCVAVWIHTHISISTYKGWCRVFFHSINSMHRLHSTSFREPCVVYGLGPPEHRTCTAFLLPPTFPFSLSLSFFFLSRLSSFMARFISLLRWLA